MSYPAKPVLIGKPVRCKGCRNAFVLQPDWVAIKVEDPPPAAPAPAPATVPAAAAPVPAPTIPPAAPPPKPSQAQVAPSRIPPATIEPISVVAPAPRPAPPKPAAPARAVQDDVLELGDEPASQPIATPPPEAAEVSVEVVEVLPKAKTTTPPPAKGSERVAKRKTEMLEAARAQMAAQLADVAAKAANSEVAKREERRSERIAKAGSAVPAGGKPAGRKAVLSGQGERHHREMMRMWAIIGIAAVVVLLLVFVFSLRSTVRESLDHYAAPVANEQNRYPVLGDAVRSRAWLASAPSMPSGPMLATDLADAEVGPERIIELEACRSALTELKDLRLDAGLELWLAPKDVDRARAVLGERRGLEAAQALAAARIRCAPHRTVVERLGLPPEDLAVVLDLICGNPPANGESFAKRIIDKGEVPVRLAVRPFSGRKGSLLQDIGRPPYRPVQGPYTGLLLRVEGDGWPSGWRVLHLAQVK